jgi:U32 family peptidase
MELLAPVGSKETLRAAVVGGADAIYLGGRRFGARRMADNFSDSELRSAVRFAHDHGVEAHITVNTLIKESELGEIHSYLDFLNSLEVDAIIVQDKGVLRLARECFSIPIHASTQMGIHSLEGVLWAEENGISRVILARELSLNQIRRIREKSKVELEVFVHGALCYCISGQCLFSSMVGGRSGNRGMCAQPCRLWYSMGGLSGYLLSTADLRAINCLPTLLKMGIDSVKIEGRMRSPLYVYLTTQTYKRAIERAQRGEELISPRESELLEVVFNRGFTQGYLVADEVMHRAYPNSRGSFIGTGIVEGDRLKLLSPLLERGDDISLYSENEKIGWMEVTELSSQEELTSFSMPVRLNEGEYQVYKTKDREFGNIQRLIGEVRLPKEQATEFKSMSFPLPIHKRKAKQSEISCYLTSIGCLERVIPYVDRVYYEMGSSSEKAKEMCEGAGVEFVIMLPRFSFEVPSIDGDRLMISTLGQYMTYKSRMLFGHYSLNFFNSLTLPEMHQCTMSVELSREEIREICLHFRRRLEIMAFGRVELMVTRDPTLPQGALVDEGGRRFQVYRDRDGLAHILNSADLLLLDYIDELESMGVDSIGLDLRRRSPALCELVTKAFREKEMRKKSSIKRKCGRITTGRYYEGVT